MRYKLLAITLIVFLPWNLFGQALPDSLPPLYVKLKKYARQSKATFLLYQTIFNTPGASDIKSMIAFTGVKNGLVIRNIYVSTRDPFGFRLGDTVSTERSFVQKLGNRLHNRTKENTIKNLLLFQEGDLTEELVLEESERIIRNNGYIRDIRIKVTQVNQDSADIRVDTQDHWTFKTSAIVTNSQTKLKITGYNLWGLGHRLTNVATWNSQTMNPLKPYLKGFYQIPSVAASLVSSTFPYRFEGENREWGIVLERPFISTFSKWAGGAHAIHKELHDSLRIDTSQFSEYFFSGRSSGVWIGRSFPLSNGLTAEERSTRICLAVAYDAQSAGKLTTDAFITNRVLSSKQTTLFSVGLTNRKYKVDRYVFQFGDDEDIPSGRKIQCTGGHEHNAYGGRYFVDAALATGGFIHKKYYASAQLNWSTFIAQGKTEDRSLHAEAFMFSPLWGGGQWKTRVFLKTEYTLFADQTYYRPLNISDDRLVPGYGYGLPEGIERISMNCTVALFNPLDIVGFRLTPILFLGGAWIGDGNSDLLHQQPQLVLGGGLAVSNKFLAQSDFKIIFAFFPNATDRYKFGSIKAWDYSFNDFAVTKPQASY